MTTQRWGPRARLGILAAVLAVASGAVGMTIGLAVAGDEAPRQPVAAGPSAPTVVAGSGGEAPAPVPSSTTSPSPLGDRPTAVAVATEPVRLVVPAIEVDAPVIPLGLNPDQTLEVPTTASDTGWWTGGSAPGAGGPAVIAGHVNLRSQPGVFADLDQVRAGDEIEVIGDDLVVVRFVVDRIERHPKDSFPTDRVYGPTEGPELRLITCGGAFDEGTGSYTDNVIVFARRAPAPA